MCAFDVVSNENDSAQRQARPTGPQEYVCRTSPIAFTRRTVNAITRNRHVLDRSDPLAFDCVPDEPRSNQQEGTP
jgi:hypothetical protein